MGTERRIYSGSNFYPISVYLSREREYVVNEIQMVMVRFQIMSYWLKSPEVDVRGSWE